MRNYPNNYPYNNPKIRENLYEHNIVPDYQYNFYPNPNTLYHFPHPNPNMFGSSSSRTSKKRKGTKKRS